MPELSAVLLILSVCSATEAVTALRTEEAPRIDGIADEPVWETAEPLRANFVQHRPDCGEPMSEETVIRVLFDDRCLYFSFIMKDSLPEAFVRMVAPRDHDFASEWIGVWLDTYNDDNNAYFFYVSVDNVQQDGRLSEVGGWDQNWDGVWRSATSVSDSGWSAELAIPFSDLRYSGTDEQEWGVNFQRNTTRTSESGFLFRMQDDGDVRIEDFGELRGLEELPASRSLQLRPYGVGRMNYDSGTDESLDTWVSAGMDTRVGLSSQLILDLTVNPDFGQVEADPDQVNLSHWETYLSEKRPFFLEGSDMFAMPFNLFYSRRIGSVAQNGDLIPILGGAKLTGTAGGFRIGFLEAVTGRIRDGDETLAGTTSYSAGRVIREFGEGTYLGLSGTSTDIPSQGGEECSYGRAAALDGQITLLDDHTLNASMGGTWNSTDIRWKDNLSYRGWYSYYDGRLDISCGFHRTQENFDANLIGYTSSTGDLETWADVELHQPATGSSVFQHYWAGITAWYDRVPGGPVTSRGISLNSGTVFRNRYHIALDIGWDGDWTDRYEGPQGTAYNGGMNYGFSCSSDYRKPLHGDLWGGLNNYCDGWNRYLGSWVRYRPFPCFSIDADLDWSTTDNARKYDWSGNQWGTRNTDWRSVEIGGNFMFSNDLGLRLTSQLSRFSDEWNSEDRSREYSHWMNVLLSWRFTPGSMYYLMVGESADPDETTGEYGDPEFILYSKVTWLI
ncbi:MAG: hypothetical protein AVO35_05470 [Candidatus Aegiribacteria sp. MLS_C]|nr:MAG: hypothetical protein AVO35_05470 [Candidatus Aegiribacteria sp. MLS_C]